MITPKLALVISLFLVLPVTICSAQQAADEMKKHEVFLQLDNDVFAFSRFDRYYTNGIFIGYNYLLNERSRLKFKLSQQIYTPQKYTKPELKYYDRPYAGVLYGAGGYQHFIKKAWFEGELLFGKIGPGSKAEEVQVWYHQVFGFPEPRGWRYQIRSGGLINLKVKSAYNLIAARGFDFWVNGAAAVGNYDRSIQMGPSFRLGRFLPGEQSYISGSRLGANGKKEFYLHMGALFKRVYWNATLQGVNDHARWNMVTMEPERLTNEYFAELVLAYPRFGFSYRIFYRSRETETASGQYLGSLRFSYLF
ncbi:lipid A deacylase LpxR family protein [Echinicola marina]|uniref:lipid A deacylase LpxR family protein n=1 Tax=Echinicola marina TaxID=2859768 RepID=UPI001CF6F18C|nr:lipid A deacylase LpxR family protein [Echinicola marina]UCS93740.1 lipid A deacylase LpxR family protein [Echinicola marina]